MHDRLSRSSPSNTEQVVRSHCAWQVLSQVIQADFLLVKFFARSDLRPLPLSFRQQFGTTMTCHGFRYSFILFEENYNVLAKTPCSMH